MSNKQKVLRRWSECYGEPFELQGRSENGWAEEQTMCTQTAEPSTEPPNGADIEITVSKLIYRKATGRDHILAELIKKGGKELKKVIDELILNKWEEEITIHE